VYSLAASNGVNVLGHGVSEDPLIPVNDVAMRLHGPNFEVGYRLSIQALHMKRNVNLRQIVWALDLHHRDACWCFGPGTWQAVILFDSNQGVAALIIGA